MLPHNKGESKMSILNVEHLSHGFGDRAIFHDVSFRLLKGEHIGLVGANGEGKSTFFNIVTGKLQPDEGKIEWAKNVRVGYLDQHTVLEKGMTIREVLKSAFSWLFELETKMNEICDRLGDVDEDTMMTLMEELGTIQDTLTMHDFYVIDAKVEEVARALGLLDLGLDKLESSYYEHVAKGVLGNAVNIVKDQYSEGGGDPAYQLNQLTQFAWNLGPGGVIETAGDAAFDVVSKLPIVGDYYSDKGVTNFAGAVDSMIGDVQSIFTGSSDSHYYQDHGGIAQGIADGVMDIGSYLYHSVFK